MGRNTLKLLRGPFPMVANYNSFSKSDRASLFFFHTLSWSATGALLCDVCSTSIVLPARDTQRYPKGQLTYTKHIQYIYIVLHA